MSFRIEIKKADNSHYWTEHFNDEASALAWVNEEQSRPYWNNFSYTVTDITSQQSARTEQDEINNQALSYLASTDWLIIREMDEGTPCPAEIKAQRAAARTQINR